MAAATDISLRNQVMYSVFVRDYSEEGTFEAVRRDLDRIKSIGTDVIWLMPIHPIGANHRKGSLGSPYAISDYRAVNPEYGTMDDFKRLVDDIHEKGMKCIIDVVYNHTSPDSVLSKEHPEWFYHKKDGAFGNKIGDWWDVIDLDYSNTELWAYQIDTLKMWAGIVDGFRCDVAPFIPIDFWMKAREEVEKVRPGCIWLSESVEPEFIAWNRMRGNNCHSDGEIYNAFDLSYDYDVYGFFEGYLTGRNSLDKYIEAINLQEGRYPANYVKLRFLENHDRLRAAGLIKDEKALRAWTAFMYFEKGMVLLYNGQENSGEHKPTLFDKDTIDYSGKDLSGLMKKLYEIKKDPVFTNSTFHVNVIGEKILGAVHTANADDPSQELPDERMIGVFPVKGESAPVRVMDILAKDGLSQDDIRPVEDGYYTNLIDDSSVEVCMGTIMPVDGPIIIKA